jgi:transcriptional regulator with XRE-family HTH domain
MNYDLIRERIKRERRALGFTQEYMAVTLGISANSYREIENGATMLINPRLDEIAKILKTPLESLIFGTLTNEEHLRKTEQLEREYQEREISLKTAHKIHIAELEGEINILKASLETKESIIGVLKERHPDY